MVFPVSGEAGARSTSALGRAVVADALRGVDPVGARSVAHETSWHSGYLVHFRRLVEAGLTDTAAARRIAVDGLASLHARMRVRRPDGDEIGLAEAVTGDPPEPLSTAVVCGGRPTERELSLPYRGERLRGDALARQLDAWVAGGIVEPSAATAVRLVAAEPGWLDLSDLRFVVLGAGAEMGPVHALLRWGADVVAVDLPRASIWTGLLATAERTAGRLHLPVRGSRGDLADRAGADLLHELAAVAHWLREADPGRGRLVVGNYAYADGATHVRVATAADALTRHLRQHRPDTAVASLATPTDVYAAPAEAVAHSQRVYQQRALLSRPVRWLTHGRLLSRCYPPDADPGIIDCLIRQQGPNYALAKRVQRWRATVTRAEGGAVSSPVAPMTRTRSVLRSRVLAAAFAGAHAFGVEVFEPATSNTLMAALLVHDLRQPVPEREHPWRDEAFAAVHGGVWRVGYAPRTAFGLAALAGLGSARH